MRGIAEGGLLPTLSLIPGFVEIPTARLRALRTLLHGLAVLGHEDMDPSYTTGTRSNPCRRLPDMFDFPSTEGTKHPFASRPEPRIAACAQVAREHGVPFHTDAAQSIGKIPTGVSELGIDLLSIAGHKTYAPKGIGALYVRTGLKLEPLIHGAGHESGRRAGTESAMLTAALGAACEIAGGLTAMTTLRGLRDQLWDALQAKFCDRVVLNGHPEQRLPNTLNVSFVGRNGAEILAALDGVAASTGSACHSGQVEISPVLRAMNISEVVAIGAIRFSLGRATTAEEVSEVVERISTCMAT